MADNTVLNTGTGGDNIRDIDRSGSGPKTQVVQLDAGGDHTQAESLVSASNPLPVVQRIGGSVVGNSNPMPVLDAYVAPVTAAWTTSTTVNTTTAVSVAGYDLVVVSLVGSSLVGGQLAFEVFDGAAWFPVKSSDISSYATSQGPALTGTLNKVYEVPVAGFPQFRVRLSTAFSAGTLGIALIVSSAPDVSVVTVGIDPSTYGSNTGANSLPVVIASDQGVLTTGGITAQVSANFTRPANTTAYANGYLVANSTTAGSVVVMSFANATRIAAGSGMIRRARLLKSGTTITNATFRLHLWATSPTTSGGDGAAINVNNSANYLGAIDIATDQAWNDGAWGAGVSRSGGELNFHLASGSTIYGLIEVKAAYTPISAEVFTVTLEILQD